MSWVMADAEFAADHYRHTLRRPHGANEPVRFRALGQQRRESGTLGRGQLPCFPAARLAPQPLPAALPCDCEPLADSATAHAERLGDAASRPALFVQLERSEPPALFPVPWGCSEWG